LSQKYNLMESKKLNRIILLKDEGFYPLIKKHTKEFENNEGVIGNIIDNWERNQPDEEENKLLEELIIKLNACKNEKFQEELFHLKELKDDIARSIKIYNEPGGYHGELNNNLTVKEFKLASRCKGIPKKIRQDFLLLTFFYEIPYRNGKKSKPNALFFYSVEWLDKISLKERNKLEKIVKEYDLHDLFHQFRFLEKEKAVKYMNFFPKLYSKAIIDCQYALKDESLGSKRKKKYRVSDKETCELITKEN
ncbi:hypothetical protein N9N67_10385, partial [Bacteriovoracaceae bacterium]|nr:hypothetical protein [Bacteriovoracaceae bacterium]